MAQEAVLVVTGEQIAVLITIVFVVVAAPKVFIQGRRLLRGSRPKPGSWAYRRALAQINLFNALTGVPQQSLIYESQWYAFGWYHIVLSLALIIVFIPFAISFLFHEWF